MPKRKLSEREADDSGCVADSDDGLVVDTAAQEHEAMSSGTGGSDDSNSSTHTSGSTDVPSKDNSSFTQLKKKRKRGVNFEGVTVFYFPRKQGFTCVPSQGGSTLGMSEQHAIVEKYSIPEYTSLQRQLHRQILLEQHQQGKISLHSNKLLMKASQSPTLQRDGEGTSSENGSIGEFSDSEDDLEGVDEYYFLQPVSTRQRRSLLRQSGIKKIEAVEKEECKEIRSSREVCGCDCKMFCDPETCLCALSGIKCQVDRLSFPCGCSKDGCANPQGRIEFNPIRVRTHFIHTLMRIELEKKQDSMKKCDHPSTRKARDKSLKRVRICEDTSPPSGSKVCAISAVEDDMATDATSIPSTSNTDTQSQASRAEMQSKHLQDSPEHTSSCRIDDKKIDEDEVEEEDDLTCYNSNENGSCRDCQKSELSDILMRETQQYVNETAAAAAAAAAASNLEMESCHMIAMPRQNFVPACQSDEVGIGLPSVNNAGESLPQVMLFSDDEDQYNAENTASAIFPFPKEDSSYSESSDCSSEGSGSGEEGPQNYSNYQNMAQYEAAEREHSCGSSDGSGHRGNDLNGGNEQFCMTSMRTNSGFHAQPVRAQAEQKFIDLNNPNSAYKLEPISEILNPIRSFTVPGGGYPSPQSWQNQEYCHFPNKAPSPGKFSNIYPGLHGPQQNSNFTGDGSSPVFPPGTHSAQNGSPDRSPGTQYMAQDRVESESPRGSFLQSLGDENCYSHNSSAAAVAGETSAPTYTSLSSSRHSSRQVDKCQGPKGKSQKSLSKDAKQPPKSTEDSKPQYHELKSSPQKSGLINKTYSISSSLSSKAGAGSFELSSQAAEAFDLTSSNPSSTAPFHLSSSQPTSMEQDIFALPCSTQQVEPVSNFELPETIVGSRECPDSGKGSSPSSSPHSELSAGDVTESDENPTQNFGEIIKESIVETVSA